MAALPFGVTERSALVTVTSSEVVATYGPWRLATSRDNVSQASLTGPYRFVTTAGPARLSFADHGLTFASNGDAGVCLRFHEPVGGIDPLHRIRHPGLTVTVADCAGLAALLSG